MTFANQHIFHKKGRESTLPFFPKGNIMQRVPGLEEASSSKASGYQPRDAYPARTICLSGIGLQSLNHILHEGFPLLKFSAETPVVRFGDFNAQGGIVSFEDFQKFPFLFLGHY
jgi:hypothetical protein